MKFIREWTSKHFVEELNSPLSVVKVIMRTNNGSTTSDAKAFKGKCHDSSPRLLKIYHHNVCSHIRN